MGLQRYLCSPIYVTRSLRTQGHVGNIKLSYALPAHAGACRELGLSYALPAYAGAHREHRFLRDTVLGILLVASNLPDDRIRHPWLRRSWRTSVSATVKAARSILRTVITRKRVPDMSLHAQGVL